MGLGSSSTLDSADANTELQNALRAAAHAAGRVAEEQLRMLPGRLDAAKRAAAAISAPHIDAAKRAAAPVWEVTKLTAARQLQAMPGRIDAAQRGAHRIWLSLPRSWPELQTLVTVQLPVLIAAAPAAAADLPRRLRAWGARQWVLAALAAVAIMSVMLLLRLPPFDGGGAVGGRFGRRSSDWMPSALGGSATSLLPPGLAADPVTAQIAADLAPWADPSGASGGGIQWHGIAALLQYDSSLAADRRLALVTVMEGTVIVDAVGWVAMPRWKEKLESFYKQLQAVLDGLSREEAAALPPVAFLVQVGSSPYLTAARLADIGRRTVPSLTLTLPRHHPGAAGRRRRGRRGGGDEDEEEEEGSGVSIGRAAWEEDPSPGDSGEDGGDVASSPGVATDASVPPVLSMARSDDEADVLYPNPYFGTPAEWQVQVDALTASADSRPWRSRKRKAFWRGSCVGFPGSLPRLQLVAMHEEPMLDVAFTRKCPVKDWAPSLFSSPADHKRVTDLASKLPKASRVDALTFSAFRMLFHLPGSTEGSYSRNLQVALGTGAVVLKWDSPYAEFYYRQLVDGVHFVGVNASTALARVAWLTSHDNAAQRIAAAASAWFRERLRGDDIAAYWLALLRAYAHLQRFRPKLPPNACTCATGQRLVHATARGRAVTLERCPSGCPS